MPTGQDGLAYGRATGSVLNIVYLSTLAVAKGGFFPNGVNGSHQYQHRGLSVSARGRIMSSRPYRSVSSDR